MSTPSSNVVSASGYIADDEDCKLLKFICQLNDALLDSGITPTFMWPISIEEGEEIFPGPRAFVIWNDRPVGPPSIRLYPLCGALAGHKGS